MKYKKLEFDPDRTFFTSDSHFGHKNIIRLCNRPFESVEEMNDQLIERWNKVVPEDGIVVHLGDFAFGGVEFWHNIREQLNGEIHLVIGNHDYQNMRAINRDDFASMEDILNIKVGSQDILCCHYPLLTWAGMERGVWNLFGHCHTRPNSTGSDVGRLEHLLYTQYDVGVDQNDFTPLSFNQVKTIINAATDRYNKPS